MRSPPFPLRHLGTQVQHVAQPAERAEGEGGKRALLCNAHSLTSPDRRPTNQQAARSPVSSTLEHHFFINGKGAMDAILEEPSKESV